jgi:hypothetical protein
MIKTMKNEIKLRSNLDLYKQLQVSKTNHLCPRRGYYLIKEVILKDAPKVDITIPVATALWKLEKNEPFLEQNTVDVQLQTLALNPFPGSSTLLENIKGKIIHVRSLYVDNSDLTQSQIVCSWGVVDLEEEIELPEEGNIKEDMRDQLDRIEESNLELENAVLDQIEHMKEWDNYESNFILDMEEHQIKIEQEAANHLSNPSA